MLQGLEISEVSLKDVLEYAASSRLDAEFFKKEYLLQDKSISKIGFLKLSEVTTKIDVGFVGAMVAHYRTEGVALLQTKNINAFFVADNETIKIKAEFHRQLKKSQVQKEDILIARSGSFGKASIYLKDEVINSSDIIIIQAIQNTVNPYFLTAFLNSKFGVSQMMRFASGGLQGHVNLTILEELEIPKIKLNFQLEIEALIKLAFTKCQHSKQTYTAAEEILLQEIGLKDFTPSNNPVNIKTLSESFNTSGRLDAEYYQNKYEAIERAIKSYPNGFDYLASFIDNYSTGYPYKSDSYIESGGVQLIRINNIKCGELDISNAMNIPSADINLSQKDIANENDILISMSGTVGNSCKIPKGVKAVINQRIMRVTPKGYNYDVLPLIINSLVGKLQLDRIGTGGVQTNISSTDIKNILIPVLPNTKQTQIAALIEESFTLKKQSEHLLEVAKRAVEIAIEENENIASRYIKEKTNLIVAI